MVQFHVQSMKAVRQLKGNFKEFGRSMKVRGPAPLRVWLVLCMCLLVAASASANFASEASPADCSLRQALTGSSASAKSAPNLTRPSQFSPEKVGVGGLMLTRDCYGSSNITCMAGSDTCPVAGSE